LFCDSLKSSNDAVAAQLLYLTLQLFSNKQGGLRKLLIFQRKVFGKPVA
jgi:hypothetical protein